VKHRRRHRLRPVGRNNGFTGKPQPRDKRPRLWFGHSRTKEMRAINEIATANETGPSDFPFGTVAKKRRADSHHGGAFFHGNLEIMTHSHAQMGQGRA
jgi:hypothetical protein